LTYRNFPLERFADTAISLIVARYATLFVDMAAILGDQRLDGEIKCRMLKLLGRKI
jgi:hypothetical protein